MGEGEKDMESRGGLSFPFCHTNWSFERERAMDE
jgi:hypothetical protein